MKCTLTIRHGSAILSDWSDDCYDLLNRCLQMLDEEKQNKCHKLTQLRAFGLNSYLKKCGVAVELIIENFAEHARFTVWSEKLRTLKTGISSEEIYEFEKKIKIDFRSPQKSALRKILSSHLAISSLGCGTGKTLLNLSVIQFQKWKYGKVKSLIVVPSACAEEYVKELSSYRGYFDLSMTQLCGKSGRQLKLALEDCQSDILLISVDSIHSVEAELQRHLSEFDGFALAIIEEGHSIKNTASRRSQALQNISPLVDQVIVSTATPIPLGPKDIRGYIALVGLPQPEEAYSDGFPSRDHNLFRGVTFVSNEEDIEYAPIQNVELEFSDLEDLNQKISDEVSALIESGEKVVVFTSTNTALCSAYKLFSKYGASVLSGSYFVESSQDTFLSQGRSPEMQKQAVNDFNFNSDCKVLIANYRVGSTGLNLQHSGAKIALFYEITNSGADFFQSKYRIRRPNVFPTNGFKYIYALPTDDRKRKQVNRQFMKQVAQQNTLDEIRRANSEAV